MFFVQLSFLFSVQCDQIGLFLKILATIFPYKSSPNIWLNFKAFAPISCWKSLGIDVSTPEACYFLSYIKCCLQICIFVRNIQKFGGKSLEANFCICLQTNKRSSNNTNRNSGKAI